MLPFGFPFADVEGLVEDQPLRRVAVRVDDDRAVVQLLRAQGDRICRHLRQDNNRNRQGNRAENHSHCSLVSGFNSRDAKRRSGSLWPRATPGCSSPTVHDHEDHRHRDKHFRIKRSHSVEQT